MIMSLHNPLSRKRPLSGSNTDEGKVKKIKGDEDEEEANKNLFSERMYSAYLNSALEAIEKNDNNQIETLASKISMPMDHNESITVQNFCIILKRLTSSISKLDNKSCSNLISAIIDYNWLEAKDKDEVNYEYFIDLYSRFLSVLVSSLPKYLHDVVSKLVDEFVYVSIEDDNTKPKHHIIIGDILRFIPTSINTLPGILQKRFPHHLSSSVNELTNYVGNLMKIVSYCPELQFNIWQIITECCIKLDVELQNEIDDLDDDEIEELIKGNEEAEENVVVNDEEVEETGKNLEADESDDDEFLDGEVEYLINTETSTSTIMRLSRKLDSVLKLLMESTNNSFTSEEIENGNGVSLFNTISSLFKSHVLSTHFTKSIQFILFRVSQYQPELSDSFLVLLIDVAFNPKEILEKRLKAMQYLSSYIARAKNLSRHQVVFVVSYLVGWLDKYVNERECEVNYRASNDLAADKTAGMERFKLFYASFQALLYIFCFRHKMLYKSSDTEETSSDSEWECNIDKVLQRMIIAKFNPLKFCDETVVFIFAKIATKLNVCYCYSIIEHNKRERMLQTNGTSSLPSSVGNFKQKQEFLDLEAYFPFDPLVLPQCKSIIEPFYVEWSEVNPTIDDEEEDDDSASLKDDELDSSDEEVTSDEDNDEEDI